jgi:hypothetical protein
MPTNVQTMIAGTAERAAARGMRQSLDETIGRYLPRVRKGIGFAVGFTIVAVGLSVHARQRHLARIEQKVDQLGDEQEEVLDRLASAREERRQRRLARRR